MIDFFETKVFFAISHYTRSFVADRVVILRDFESDPLGETINTSFVLTRQSDE